ncbi:esterase-like activity of phytase family protein [Alkalimarinus alittae]|uniref:Esterase-like activity of phytase family protein n=1 Tax=Alkalimarinus alittae TaxID=2961619 RepID=A0ABY6N2I1_9ALTE|nr:esterase-like activity of phytase family protein [Alkalimarinus alittae]UZE96250.1 esterase-like activity of phytase family protein [Alkalimarinus alittae]
MRDLPLYQALALALSLATYSIEAKELIDTPSLVLEQYWTLSGVSNLQPSGLSFCGSHLVMISDRHSHTIFSVPLNNTKSAQHTAPDKSSTHAQIKTFRKISPFTDLPDNITWQVRLIDWALRWTSKRFDWEGIHCNIDGSLYLASESLTAIAKIDPTGHPSWITQSLTSRVQRLGFATTLNTGFEGITANSARILVALEREPRGLMSITKKTHPPSMNKLKLISHEEVVSPLNADFTGLWLETNAQGQPKIYTLERNYFRVCRRDYENWTVEVCWSYRATEQSPEFRFENDRYGLAEGIARSGEHIYIVLDNNGEPRQQSGDKSPLLFKFKRPDNW